MTRIFNSLMALGFRRLVLLSAFGWMIAAAETIVLPLPAAHADSIPAMICQAISQNPTEAGVYNTFHDVLIAAGDTDTATALADYAIGTVCPQWQALVMQTARDLQAAHPQQQHIWA